MPRRRRAEPDDIPPATDEGRTHPPPPAVAEILLDAIGLAVLSDTGPGGATPPRGTDADADQGAAPDVRRLPLTPPWTIEDPELRQLCARAVLEARCGRLWHARRPVVLEGARGWLESMVLGEDGVPLERRDALRLPWQEARQHEHAAVLLDMATQTAVRCLWRGRPDLPKGLKLGAAAPILDELERGPTG